MAVAETTKAIDVHYPGTGWIRVGRSPLTQRKAHRAERGLPGWDATVQDLLGSARTQVPT